VTLVRRALNVDDLVPHRATVAGERLLELRLVIHEGRERVVDASRERGDDRLLDLLEAVLGEQRAERGFEQRREDVAVADEPVELVLGENLGAALEEPATEVQLARHDRTALARDDVRANLRQASLGEVRMILEKRPCDRQLEHAVTEELEPLVRECPVGRPGRVSEDGVGSPSRQLVDQSCELLGLALRSSATGAR
jgi:hypothetical protein